MRKKIVAGNWKMNGLKSEAKALLSDIVEKNDSFSDDVRVIVAPSFIYLNQFAQLAADSKVEVVAQNCADKDSGAYTGEISASMLRSIGINASIIGHSERRHIYGESIRDTAEKTLMLLNQNMEVIFCVGEQLSERNAGTHFEVIDQQLEAISNLEAPMFEKVIVAYEPVWAIGTGETASPEQAQEMHAYIREQLRKSYGDLADQISILYGGSVKPGNAAELFGQEDVDGGLVGGPVHLGRPA